MATKLPNDNVLVELLSNGGWETLLRVGTGRESAAPASADIIKRYPGITIEGARYLAIRAEQAYLASRALTSMSDEEHVDLGTLPKIPTTSVPGAEPGDIVMIGKQISPGTGPHGTDSGIDTITIFSVSPTRAEILQAMRDRAIELRRQYDMGELDPEDFKDAIEQTYGWFIVEE